jgi:hypothetical protein
LGGHGWTEATQRIEGMERIEGTEGIEGIEGIEMIEGIGGIRLGWDGRWGRRPGCGDAEVEVEGKWTGARGDKCV